MVLLNRTTEAAQAISRDPSEEPPPLLALLVVILAGLLSAPLFALRADSFTAGALVTAIAWMVAGAALLVGGLAGFLFGIPRRLQQEAPPNANADQGGGTLYSANTNLEQISDWLTKIIVGVGLTQITEVDDVLRGVGRITSAGFGGLAGGDLFGMALVVYFSVSGFLLVYLWTRLHLGRALTEADRTSALRKELSRLEAQANADAAALLLVGRQLTGPEGDAPAQAELDAAVTAASPETREHIFHRAKLQRVRNWKDQATKATMERAIPVFRALVASDTERRYHQNHGELGYALKEQRTPAWAEAAEALTTAIERRGNPAGTTFRSYEFNRAVCRIALDAAYRQGQPSAQEAQRVIVEDLRVAVQDEWVRKWVQEDPTLKKWMALNGCTLEQFLAPAGPDATGPKQ